MTRDLRGLALTGADAAQARRFDSIVQDYFDYRLTCFPALKELCEQAPEFAMAHLLKGFLLLSLGTRANIAPARACYEKVGAMAPLLSERERQHLAALGAWVNGDTVGACSAWDEALFDEPLDILALKLQHFSMFWMGRSEHMRDATARVLPHWGEDVPGFAHVLGMHAFGLEETGSLAAAEKIGRRAVELHADDLWAIHAVAHVFEMQGRLDEGVAWLNQPLDQWSDRNPFKGHLRWHAALFAFDQGHFDRTLALYDQAVRPAESTFYLDIQNSASLLARLEFAGINVGPRWEPLADSVEARLRDHMLIFTEPHCAMVLGRTGRFESLEMQIASLKGFAEEAGNSSRHAVRNVVVPLCEAICDFYKDDFGGAVKRLIPLRYDYQCIGGSHAQRDVFSLYLIDAATRCDKRKLARSLLTERISRFGNSQPVWDHYAHSCAALGEPVALKQPLSILALLPDWH